MTKEEAIFDVISKDAAIKAVVEGRIFPVVAPAGTKMPYLIWSTSSRSQEGTKDADERTIVASISFVEGNYLSAHAHANLVKPAFLARQEDLEDSDLYYPEFLQETDKYNPNLEYLAYWVQTDITLEQKA